MVQKGNPHQLPIRQHTLPTKSIARFCEHGGVEVQFVRSNRRVRLKPDGDPFYVKQHWDAKAEGHFKEIEDSFQSMVEGQNLANGSFITGARAEIILKMFASWYARAHFKKPGDRTINGILGPSRNMSQDEREQMEKAGVMTIGDDCSIWGRQMAWPQLMFRMNDIQKSFERRQWGLMTSNSGEFLVPDKPPNNIVAIPIAPKQLLIMDYPNQAVQEDVVRQVNDRFLSGSEKYYFARNLDACPK